MPDVRLQTLVTCPECGTETETFMPTDRCRVLWTCPACGATLTPDADDCCVFCSHGSAPCPPVQRNGHC